MGKLILCTGRLAKIPYQLPFTGIRVYSIEELCYYIYSNLDMISEDLFQEDLPVWIKEQLGLEEAAKKLEQLITGQGTLKDMAVTILCSADYYGEEEILSVIHFIDDLAKRQSWEREKLRADNRLRFRDYAGAARIYKKILFQEEAAVPEEKAGDILHNYAMTLLHSISPGDAAPFFKRAYAKNHKEESLYAYLHSLHLSEDKEGLQRAFEEYSITEEQKQVMAEREEKARWQAENESEYRQIQKLSKLAQEGKLETYYEGVGEVITRWKEDYRNGLA